MSTVGGNHTAGEGSGGGARSNLAPTASGGPPLSRLPSGGSNLRRQLSGSSTSSVMSTAGGSSGGLSGFLIAGGGSTVPSDGGLPDCAAWHALQQLKLADFGLSKAVEAEAVAGVGTVCGTPEYMSPEVAAIPPSRLCNPLLVQYCCTAVAVFWRRQRPAGTVCGHPRVHVARGGSSDPPHSDASAL